ncbi:acyltransferase domain-containing protein [Arthrobacter sp. LAPM80]|uniref:acyltransferase domain-containing protein n=1 Tax=Arthrobacter sp. LAPM80 TaxID=3141788 RepID=UPI00398B9288
MTPRTALSPEMTLDALNVEPGDRAGCLALLEGPASPAVEKVLAHLAARLGSADESNPELGTPELPVTEMDWLSAMMRFVPDIRQWHGARGISAEISLATLADFGRNMAINRRVHHRFGMDTYKWLNNVFSGRLYQLGRLQYLIHQPSADIPGVGAGEWILGVHIPEGGDLSPAVVAESLALAAPFFAEHFPEKPVQSANCESWLLDPYLGATIAEDSNIARFAALFTPYGEPRNEPTDAVYFTFRTRNMDNLDALPRTTALQRVVLERIDAGGTWQLGFGFVALPR